MTVQLRAHFDGRVLISEEPVDLPVNQMLNVQVEVPPGLPNDTEARLAALDRIAARAVSANLPAKALTRDSIYEDRP
ncbi:MAG: hypothetical protein AMXMBFR13_51470 [Phycisphaerae bacterium]